MSTHSSPAGGPSDAPVTDRALPLADVCRRLGMSRGQFYGAEQDGYWTRYGLVELPRRTAKGKRRFSAASLDRLIRLGAHARRRAS